MKRSYVYIILAAIIFSTMEIAGKTIAQSINPFQLNFIRFLLGGLILLPISLTVLKRKKLVLHTRDYGYFFFTGFLGIVVSMTFFQFAVLYTMASTVAIIFSANPAFTAPFAYLLLKENLSKSVVLSLGISLLGVLCILNPFALHADMNGMLLVFFSAVTFALYSVLSKKRVKRYGGVVISCFSFLAGDAILLGLMLLSHLPLFALYKDGVISRYLVNIPIFDGIDLSNLGVLLYMGIVVSGLGFLFYFLAMEKTSTATASVVFFIKPALAPLFCLAILKETITSSTIIGIGLILAGAYLMLLKQKRPAAKTKEVYA